MERTSKIALAGRLAAFSVIVIVAVVAAPRTLSFVAVLEDWLADTRVAWLAPVEPQHKDIVVLGIDEATLARLPYRSPVDRGALAEWLTLLEAANVRAVGLDILFDQPTEPEKDELFARVATGASMPIVVAWADQQDGLTDQQRAFQRDYAPGLLKGIIYDSAEIA